MALIGDELYVADTDALLRFPYHAGQTRITAPGVKIVDLPAGPINHHWTKNVIASPDGRHLYVTIGSNSNAGENGIAVEDGRAAIWEVEPRTGQHRVFASGLRNSVGLGWEKSTGTLWTSVNERDEIGSDLVPDYLTSVKDGGFHGWPYSYFGQHVDERVRPPRPDLGRPRSVPIVPWARTPRHLALHFRREAVRHLSQRAPLSDSTAPGTERREADTKLFSCHSPTDTQLVTRWTY